MTVKESCEEFLVYLSTVRGMTDNTIAAYSEDYKKLCEFLGEDAEIDKVSLQDLRFCVGSLSAQKYSVASINRFIASVRALFAYSQKFGRLKINPALLLNKEFDADGKLSFTRFGVPFEYELSSGGEVKISVDSNSFGEELNEILSYELFERKGKVKRVKVEIPKSAIFD